MENAECAVHPRRAAASIVLTDAGQHPMSPAGGSAGSALATRHPQGPASAARSAPRATLSPSRRRPRSARSTDARAPRTDHPSARGEVRQRVARLGAATDARWRLPQMVTWRIASCDRNAPFAAIAVQAARTSRRRRTLPPKGARPMAACAAVL
jgi:hypothetical protein